MFESSLRRGSARLHELLETDPRDLGLPYTSWTINRLRLYLAEETDILLSYTRFRSLKNFQLVA